MPAAHLVLISDRIALSWVLTEQRMAFPPTRARAVRQISEGDEVFLYSTRGCFGNPTRDVGRVIATARVTEAPRTLDEPVVFGERRFTEGCRLAVDGLAPFREGLSLREHVERLSVFPDPKTWSVRLRRASLQLPPQDADHLREAVRLYLKPYAEAVDAYRWPR
ncbi:hypothetical protein [Streptomyces chilikensis]|uniref:hypothetical protein n=1 Tax=Streptomyces chilikensis TaxID=1194079 RepID=UPI000AEADD53|nr:hypothetical protein [Streptomyces chilikensis]